MRVGLLVHRPEQIERFEPLARRLPGARFCLPGGRWPSGRVDSRAEIVRFLAARGLPPVIEARPEWDVVLCDAGLPAAAVRPWLRPRGAVVQWKEPGDGRSGLDPILVLAAGEALRPREAGLPFQAVGDPLLDGASETGARGRARAFLGLDGRPERPVVLVHAEGPRSGVDALAGALARLRVEAEVVTTVGWERRLASGPVFPAALQGPGTARLMAPLGSPCSRADLLAASDLVVADPGLFLGQALALGRPAVGCGPWLRRPGHPLCEGPLGRLLDRVEWIRDAGDLPGLLEVARHEPSSLIEGALPDARALFGPADGRAVRRMVAALQLLGPWRGADLAPLGA